MNAELDYIGAPETVEESNPFARIDLRRFLLVAIRRWYFILFITILFTTAGVAIALPMRGSEYEAKTVILHTEAPRTLSVGDGAHFELSTPDLNTLVDTIKLPTNLKKIVTRLELPMDFRDLANSITLSKATYSKLINISTKAETPELSVELANTTAEVFIEYLVSLRQQEVDSALEKLDALIYQADAKFTESSNKLTDFRKKHGIVKLDVEAEISLENLGELTAKIEESKIELGMLANQLWRSGSSDTQAGGTESVLHLESLQRQYAEMKTRYTNENPRLVKLEKEIAAAKNEVATSMKTRLRGQQSQIRSKISTMEKQRDELQATLQKLTDNEKNFATVQQDYVFAKQMVENLMGRREEASAIAQDTQGEFRVIEEAVEPRYPLKSKAMIVAIAFPVIGFCFILFWVLVKEAFNPRLASAREVNTRYKLPIIGQHLHDNAAPKNEAFLKPNVYKPIVSTLNVSKTFDGKQVIGFFSTLNGSGQTTVCKNLAHVLASRGENILVLQIRRQTKETDTAWATPRQLDAAGALETRIIRNQKLVPDQLNVVTETADDLYHFTRLTIPAILDDLTKSYSRILIDCPPLFTHITGIEVIEQLDSIIFVVRAFHTEKDHMERLTRLLVPLGTDIMGVFITDAEPLLTRKHEVIVASAYQSADYGSRWMERQLIKKLTKL